MFATLCRSFVPRPNHALLGLFALGAVACDDASKETSSDPVAVASGALICNYEHFEVEITDGPSHGLRVDGSLLLTMSPPSSALVGMLETTDGSVPVTGAMYGEGDISLTFHTPDGYIMGLGHAGDDFCKEGMSLTGRALGPRVDGGEDSAQSDSGHWIVTNPDRLIRTIDIGLLPIDPVIGIENNTAAEPAGCNTTGNTTVCYSAVYHDAGSATGCSQSTATCIYDGRAKPCSGTSVPVDCPNN